MLRHAVLAGTITLALAATRGDLHDGLSRQGINTSPSLDMERGVTSTSLGVGHSENRNRAMVGTISEHGNFNLTRESATATPARLRLESWRSAWDEVSRPMGTRRGVRRMAQRRRSKARSALLAGFALGVSLVATVFALSADSVSANDASIFTAAIFAPLGIAMWVWPR